MNLKQYLETGTVVTLRDNSQFLIMNNMVNAMGQKENVGISFPITERQYAYLFLNDYLEDLHCFDNQSTHEATLLYDIVLLERFKIFNASTKNLELFYFNASEVITEEERNYLLLALKYDYRYIIQENEELYLTDDDEWQPNSLLFVYSLDWLHQLLKYYDKIDILKLISNGYNKEVILKEGNNCGDN